MCPNINIDGRTEGVFVRFCRSEWYTNEWRKEMKSIENMSNDGRRREKKKRRRSAACKNRFWKSAKSEKKKKITFKVFSMLRPSVEGNGMASDCPLCCHNHWYMTHIKEQQIFQTSLHAINWPTARYNNNNRKWGAYCSNTLHYSLYQQIFCKCAFVCVCQSPLNTFVLQNVTKSGCPANPPSSRYQ